MSLKLLPGWRVRWCGGYCRFRRHALENKKSSAWHRRRSGRYLLHATFNFSNIHERVRERNKMSLVNIGRSKGHMDIYWTSSFFLFHLSTIYSFYFYFILVDKWKRNRKMVERCCLFLFSFSKLFLTDYFFNFEKEKETHRSIPLRSF